MGAMRACLGVKVVQSIVSISCQIAFLVMTKRQGLTSPTTSATAKALFISNILISTGGAILGIILYGIKRGSLAKLEKQRDEDLMRLSPLVS